MLRFVNNKGKKVMEMKDSGELKIKDAKLAQELQLQEGVVVEEEKQEDKE